MKEKTIRNNQIMLRFSDIEFEQVKKLHGSNKYLAVAIRDYVLGLPVPEQITKIEINKKTKPRPQHFRPIDPAYLRQIAGIANNINQIAKTTNQNKDRIDRLQIIGLLAQIEKQMNELIKIGYRLSDDS